MTARIFARNHFTRGLDFIYLSDNRLPNGYGEHSHDYIEIVITVEGRAKHRINGRLYDTVPGDVCVIQGGDMHGFELATKDFRVINIMYLPEKVVFPLPLLLKLPGYHALFVIEPAQRLEGEFRASLRLDSLGLSSVLALARRMEDELEGKRLGFESILHALLLELVATLSRDYSKSPEAGAQKLLRMGEAVAWMETNYASQVSLSELAKKASVSERQFLRLFTKAFGHPPVEHLLRIRVNAAAQMLKKSGCRVSEAAFACGFNDSSYFTRQFKRILGVAPKRYTKLEP